SGVVGVGIVGQRGRCRVPVIQVGQLPGGVVAVLRVADLGAAVQVAVAGDGRDLVARRVGQVQPQGGLAAAAELAAGQQVDRVVDRSQHAAEGILPLR